MTSDELRAVYDDWTSGKLDCVDLGEAVGKFLATQPALLTEQQMIDHIRNRMREAIKDGGRGNGGARLAHRVGLVPQQISAVVNGHANVTMDIALRLGFQRLNVYRPFDNSQKRRNSAHHD